MDRLAVTRQFVDMFVAYSHLEPEEKTTIIENINIWMNTGFDADVRRNALAEISSLLFKGF